MSSCRKTARAAQVIGLVLAACAAPRSAAPAQVLVVEGRVDHPFQVTVAELRRWPKVTERLLLVCPGAFEARGEWSGVALGELLRRAGARADAVRVRLTGADGYEQEVPMAQARSGGMLLAYEVDGHALGPTEGAPLRVAARDQPGSVWVQHLVRIEVR